MTYNWNNMVSITVPTGTNGWLYSGEVIINGVKVRFPVGVPTSVPEPAAALLKKMIELEQEEDANTAKPQNHYVGDVTIPAGKTLTLEKGAKYEAVTAGRQVRLLVNRDGKEGIAVCTLGVYGKAMMFFYCMPAAGTVWSFTFNDDDTMTAKLGGN